MTPMVKQRDSKKRTTMPSPNEMLWAMEPHTKAKHVILKHYLEAWFPILSSAHGRVIYFDGFAGPGRYQGGEEGSPLIALNVAASHKARLRSEILFYFVENQKDRAARLETEISSLTLPKNFKWALENAEFEAVLRAALDKLDSAGLELAPTFAFIDPFGVKGLPFDLIGRLLSRQSCEVFITFMNVTIQRFVTELPQHINALIGDASAAEQIQKCKSAEDRALLARTLYARSLSAVAKYVRFFEMRDTDNRPIYDLFFASNHSLGHYRMKEAMWKANESGEYSFSDGIDPGQAVLFKPDPANDLALALWSQHRGKNAYCEDILEYTRDHTAYLEKHARAALKILESHNGLEGKRISVAVAKRSGGVRRKGTFPDGTLITFME